VRVTTSDEHGITEEEFEAAKAHLLERYGLIPPSLQSVIDRGGRFRLADPAAREHASRGPV
jgi:hypothetical protein